MPRRIAVTLLLLLALPLVALLLFAKQMTADRDAVIEMQLRELVDAKLLAIDTQIQAWLNQQVQNLIPGPGAIDPTRLQTLALGNPLLRQVHVLNADGFWVSPIEPSDQLQNLSPDAVFAAVATEQMSRPALRKNTPWFGSLSKRPSPVTGRAEQSAEFGLAMQTAFHAGWLVRYEQQQLQLLRWASGADGSIWLFELSYPALLAALIGELPDTSPDTGLEGGGETALERLRLRDASDRVLYEWGSFEVDDGATPQSQLMLSQPLGSWRLEYYSALSEVGAGLAAFRWWIVVLLVALGTVLLGMMLWRQQRAEFARAEQRVSFVNQVSHELKTPLTNIRMYAELLQQRIAPATDTASEGDKTTSRQLAVIVGESQRLSRLINNVLTFGRKQRGQLELQYRLVCPDNVIQETLLSWEMALHDAGLKVAFSAAAANELRLDADALEQILNNLIGNAEKYAGGGALTIASSLVVSERNGRTSLLITVADQGPGIKKSERNHVFQPFYRVSDANTEGVSGTGIGLALARDLAVRHGGDLRLVDSDVGCCFEVTLLEGEG